MFKDSTNREFAAVIVLPTITELRKINVNLGRGLSEVMSQLADDPALLGDVLWIVHRDSIQMHGLTDEQFGRILDGNTLAAAVESLEEAIINFSPPATRPALRKLAQKGKEVLNLAGQSAVTEIEALSAETILNSLSDSAGSTPASVDSIPQPELSGNSSGPPGPGVETNGTASDNC